MPPDSDHDLNRREQPVYRPSHRDGMDATTRRLAIAAGGIGVVLAALVGGWSLMGHHAGGVPVIEAPTGPERVKPADPGGLQLMGAEPPPANAGAAGTGPSLAPGPETPDPKALQAELDRAGRDDAPAPTATSTPATSTPATSAPATSAPAPAKPTPPPPMPPAPAPAPAPARTAPVGRVEVQLAAMDTDALAHAEWSRLTRKAPALFGDRRPAVSTASRAGRTFYRLRTGGFATIAEATAFCARVRAIGGACTIAAF